MAGIFDIFRKRQEKRSYTVLPDVSGIYGVDAVYSEHLALNIATFYRCVDILSKGIAQLPLELKVKENGFFKVAEDHPLTYLLSCRPNPRMTAFEFFRNIVLQVMIRGNAYVLPRRDDSGAVAELVLLSPMSVTYDKISGKYIVADTVNHVSGTFTEDKIIHIRNLSTDGGFTGLSTIQCASRVLAISSNADQNNVDTFRTGGVLKGFISGNGGQTVGFGQVQDKQLETVADDVQAQLNGGKKIFTLPGEMRFQQLQLSPSDIQLLATKEFNAIEICRFTGVHPDKAFIQQSANYKASEMSQVAFLSDTLQPWLRQIENEFQVKLIRREDYGRYRLDFNIEPIMQTDLSTQVAYLKGLQEIGGITANEIRHKLGKDSVDGGDTSLVSANMVPLNSGKLWGQQSGNNNKPERQ